MVEIVRQNYKNNKKLYKNVYSRLFKQFEQGVIIEHVGSTAIPFMWGKNIIDILIGVHDEREMDSVINILINNGFFEGNKKQDVYRFFASRKEETRNGDVHIHLALINTDRFNDFILLRNYLLANKEEVIKYSNFKKSILRDNIRNRKEYKFIKSGYVDDLLNRARMQK